MTTFAIGIDLDLAETHPLKRTVLLSDILEEEEEKYLKNQAKTNQLSIIN